MPITSRSDAVPDWATSSRPSSAMRRISSSPLSSPTGAAPDRQNFNPLYSGGLCEAVTITPGIDHAPAA